jgi:hypothetical protein
MFARLLVVLAAALALAPSALAKGGSYVFDGGTPAQRAQVAAALAASSFDFSVVRAAVTVHIARGADSRATPGQVWLDADLLDGGSVAWGVVQHEFAHQVDDLVLDDAGRAALQAALGGRAWCSGAAHGDLGCERFADLVAWAYWQSPDNVMRPDGAADEGGQLAPAAFRALLARLLPSPPARQTAAVVKQAHPKRG